MNTYLLGESNVQAIFSLSTYRATQISVRVGRETVFKITRSDLFVDFLNHLLLEKIANRSDGLPRIFDYPD